MYDYNFFYGNDYSLGVYAILESNNLKNSDKYIRRMTPNYWYSNSFKSDSRILLEEYWNQDIRKNLYIKNFNTMYSNSSSIEYIESKLNSLENSPLNFLKYFLNPVDIEIYRNKILKEINKMNFFKKPNNIYFSDTYVVMQNANTKKRYLIQKGTFVYKKTLEDSFDFFYDYLITKLFSFESVLVLNPLKSYHVLQSMKKSNSVRDFIRGKESDLKKITRKDFSRYINFHQDIKVLSQLKHDYRFNSHINKIFRDDNNDTMTNMKMSRKSFFLIFELKDGQNHLTGSIQENDDDFKMNIPISFSLLEDL